MTIYPSPNQRYQVELHTFEMRMSHWVSAPCLSESASGQALLDLSQTLWHAEDVKWDESGEQVTLQLRHYPGILPAILLTLIPAVQRAIIQKSTTRESMHIADVPGWLQQYAS